MKQEVTIVYYQEPYHCKLVDSIWYSRDRAIQFIQNENDASFDAVYSVETVPIEDS